MLWGLVPEEDKTSEWIKLYLVFQPLVCTLKESARIILPLALQPVKVSARNISVAIEQVASSSDFVSASSVYSIAGGSKTIHTHYSTVKWAGMGAQIPPSIASST